MNAPVVKAENAASLKCHETTRDKTGQNLIAEYKQSGHYTNLASNPAPKYGINGTGCAACHGTSHNDANPSASGRCYECHGAVLAPSHRGNSTLIVSNNCATCHNGHNPLGPFVSGRCLSCHAVGQDSNAVGSYVNDNNGVRAVVSEFSRTSHHVTGKVLTDADCAVCHMEGTIGGDVDTSYHMKDNKIHLRNGNPGIQSAAAEYIWDPASPNHSDMDKFCMSCHNSAGAPAAVGIVAGNSATNPFNDTISNGVDGVARNAVVGVYEQFDPSNRSHHGVRAAKYSGRTRATTANPSVFTQYSGAAVSPIYATSGTYGPSPSDGTILSKSNLGASLHTNSLAGIGPTSPGTRMTIYEAGFFVATYTPLGDTRSVADDSVIHCGDCHTVGQFKAGSTTNAAGVATTAVIGAHGSNNEYLLRTSTGVDEIHVNAEFASETTSATGGTSVAPAGTVFGAPYNMKLGIGGPVRPTGGSVALTNPTENFYVCFLCHKANVYGATEAVPFAANPTLTYGETRMGGHGGLHPCNDPVDAESTGKVGSARVNYFGGGEKGGGNLFGYTCAHCHNAGNKGFGGIHGSNTAFGNYSAAGGWANSASTDANVARVSRQTYRFMGGLSLKYNGGATASKWESQVLQKSNREGCYNFSVNSANVSSTGSAKGGGATLVSPATVPGRDYNGAVTAASLPGAANTQWRTDDASAAEFSDGTSGAQIFGTWGACGHHNGSTASGANATSLRKVQRPLTY
jgi:hypothetical protein